MCWYARLLFTYVQQVCVIYWPGCFHFSSLSPLCTVRGRVQHMDWQDWWRVWEFYILNNWISCPLYRKLYKTKRTTDTGRVRQTIVTLANVLHCLAFLKVFAIIMFLVSWCRCRKESTYCSRISNCSCQDLSYVHGPLPSPSPSLTGGEWEGFTFLLYLCVLLQYWEIV